jgi:hypothetical protein
VRLVLPEDAQKQLQSQYTDFAKIRLRHDKKPALHQGALDNAIKAAWDIVKQRPEAMIIARSEQISPDKKAIRKTNEAAMDHNAEGMRFLKQAEKAFGKSRAAMNDQASLLDDETACLD